MLSEEEQRILMNNIAVEMHSDTPFRGISFGDLPPLIPGRSHEEVLMITRSRELHGQNICNKCSGLIPMRLDSNFITICGECVVSEIIEDIFIHVFEFVTLKVFEI